MLSPCILDASAPGRAGRVVFAAFVVAVFLSVRVQAAPVVYVGSGTDPAGGAALSASAAFEQVDDKLVLTLTCLGDPATVPSTILTGVFFSLAGNPALVPVDVALADGSDVLLNASGENTDLRLEWEYRHLLTPIGGATQGISSAGLGVFGQANFGGQAGNNVNGMSYGLVNGISAAANSPVKKGTFVNNAVRFTLSGYAGEAISTVRFQYGTSLSEALLTGASVPEPGSLTLLAPAALGMARRRRRN